MPSTLFLTKVYKSSVSKDMAHLRRKEKHRSKRRPAVLLPHLSCLPTMLEEILTRNCTNQYNAGIDSPALSPLSTTCQLGG